MCKPNKAKDFLNRLKKIDKMIANKEQLFEIWKARAYRTSSQLGSERVQRSGSQQKMADAVDAYVDIEWDIAADLKRLYEEEKEIISVIEQLDTTEYDLLHKVYVQNITLEDVADSNNKTYSWATTIHGRALKHVENILNEREMA